MRVRLNLEVEIHKADEGGYWASVKGVPGCYSQGETKAEVTRNIREAIAAHFDLPEKPKPKRSLRAAGPRIKTSKSACSPDFSRTPV